MCICYGYPSHLVAIHFAGDFWDLVGSDAVSITGTLLCFECIQEVLKILLPISDQHRGSHIDVATRGQRTFDLHGRGFGWHGGFSLPLLQTKAKFVWYIGNHQSHVNLRHSVLIMFITHTEKKKSKICGGKASKKANFIL